MKRSWRYMAWNEYWRKGISPAPLATFRVVFGLVMLLSTLRYVYMGWIETQLVEPLVHFSYFGFDWVQPLPLMGMYAVFGLMALACIGIALGWYYRLAAVSFFLLFTYVELIDISFYLNHYYFVSLVAFLMIWLPAHKSYSLDTQRNPNIRRDSIPRWCIDLLKIQIAIVYVYAGLAKINADWLLEALPLSIWLPAKSSLPLIGGLLEYRLTAYVFSWAGMLFDTFIIAGLLWRKTRPWAYTLVVVFHTMTGILFQIGIFPMVMIGAVTLFFSVDWHEGLWRKINGAFAQKGKNLVASKERVLKPLQRVPRYLLLTYVLFQLMFPWRHMLYDGPLFWTEEGYRFSWRVMLMEKAGTATFYVKNSATGKEGVVINHRFLTDHQEKQMSMQPDMILQYAHFLRKHYESKGMTDPEVRAEVWVTLNGRPSQLLIDPHTDLTQINDSWQAKDWILPWKS